MVLVDEVRKGSRAGLVALRDVLAEAIVAAEVREVAGLAARLQAVMAALDALPNSRELSPLDEIAAKRSKRRVAAGSGGAGKGVKRGARSG